MRRIIDQLNVSITTNRTCTLRCDHCYIEPELFSNKQQMTSEVFRQVFAQVERLFALDQHLHEVEWEVIGGETTMMPYEWWEKELPWALDRIAQFNKRLRNPGSLNFLTNLIYADTRYTDLLSQYADHPVFCLYTSWEPDTNRFGRRNQLFGRFYETLCAIPAKQKILDIILTKKVIEIGPEAILEQFLPAGVTDFSIKMISPYGSGKAFFEPNMPSFQEMSDFFLRFDQLKPEGITFTPQEEMLSSLLRGTSYQCNGNFKYDLSVEPDGRCHFNANQTGSESALGSQAVFIEDPMWAEKVCFENTTEQNNKLTLKHAACDQCEYLTACNAGWYHYKTHDPDVIAGYAQTECPGFKQFWAANQARLQPMLLGRSKLLHMDKVKHLISSARKPVSAPKEYAAESGLTVTYDGFFEALKGVSGVCLDLPHALGHNLLERLWFYRDIGMPVVIDELALAQSMHFHQIVEHYVYGNLDNLVMPIGFITEYARHYRTPIARRIAQAIDVVVGVPGAEGDLIIDARNEELFRFVFRLCKTLSLVIDPTDEYLLKLREHLESEDELGDME